MNYIQQYEGFIRNIKGYLIRRKVSRNSSSEIITDEDFDTIYDLFLSEFESEFKDISELSNLISLNAIYFRKLDDSEKSIFTICRGVGEEKTSIEIAINLSSSTNKKEIVDRIDLFKVRLSKFGFALVRVVGTNIIRLVIAKKKINVSHNQLR